MWVEIQGQSHRQCTRRDHSSEGGESWRAQWAEAVSSRGGTQGAGILNDCRCHSRDTELEGSARGKSSWNLAKRCALRKNLKDDWGDWADWVLQELGSRWRNVYMWKRQGLEKQKRNSCRCEALDVSGLDKINLKKKIAIHQFLTSIYYPHPLLPFHCG